MFIDKRNGNLVSIIKESSSSNVLVKNIKTNKKYIIDKENLKEIKAGE